MNCTKFCFTMVIAGALVGCGRGEVAEDSDAPEIVVMEGPPPMLDEHAHGTHGPHGGELIEIGKATFHGELVHDATSVTIYVLDEAAESSVPIDAESVTLSLKHDGKVQSFQLAAATDAGDPAGMSSRFVSNDAVLASWMQSGSEGALVMQVDGKSYTGAIAHDHSH